ncbi:uncharacterized protein LOC115228143 [Octopus sinensis]|uniref:Uncharacterized protein LOC115228143 n=1 Tax=Octopus sinensis TaxID=2607531 RepID=A0A6P7TZG1_9MOLL|nr:uncharacterized protein LOC115228143 [Octopus sinensis]
MSVFKSENKATIKTENEHLSYKNKFGGNITVVLKVNNPSMGSINIFNTLCNMKSIKKARVSRRQSGEFLLNFKVEKDVENFQIELEESKPFGEGGQSLKNKKFGPVAIILKNVPTWIEIEELEDFLKGKVKGKMTLEHFEKRGVRLPIIKLVTSDHGEAQSLVRLGLKIGFSNVKAEWYRKPEVQCYRCQGFGHIARFCKNQEKCLFCSGTHAGTDCKDSNMKKCVNCGSSSHLANYRGCEKAKEASKLKNDKILFRNC